MDKKKLYEDLARDEGKKLKAYKDTKGFWTIGIGHLLGTEARMTEITDDECRALFEFDIQASIDIIHKLFPRTEWFGWNNHENVRMRALVNMAFNRGERHMRESTTITPAILAAMQDTLSPSPLWKNVGDAIRKSPWAAVVGNRAERLAHMLETGEDPA